MTDSALPTLHRLRAALKVSLVIDSRGVSFESARESFLHLPTGGLYRFEDLMAGAKLLERAGLLSSEGDGWRPTPELLSISSMPEADACEILLSILIARHPPLWFFG